MCEIGFIPGYLRMGTSNRSAPITDIDDDFAKKLGDYADLDELKNAITENLKQGYAKRTEHELN